MWFIALVFFTIDLTYFYTTFLSTERIDGFKHIQLMSNVSPFIYWISNLIFDSIFFFLIVVLRILAIKAVDDSDGFLRFGGPYCEYFLLLNTKELLVLCFFIHLACFHFRYIVAVNWWLYY